MTGNTVVPVTSARRTRSKPARPKAPVTAGPLFPPCLLPALNRYAELLDRYGQQPGETCAGDVFRRMNPADRQEAVLLAECLDPVLAPRLLAARTA